MAQIAVDSNGNINVVWEDNPPGNEDIFFSRSVNDGATFSAPQNLSNTTGLSEFQQIAVDNVGNVNIAFSDATSGSLDVFFTQFVVDDDSVFSQLNGGNTFNGNQTVNGTLTATNVVGNGAGLTGVAAATAAVANFANSANFANTAGFATSSGTATTAANALSLGGIVAGNYARLDVGNNFRGDQAVTGNVSTSGALSATGPSTLTGPVTIGGGTAIVRHLSKTFAVSVPAVSPNNCVTLAAITFTGASDGDSIALGVPAALVEGGSGSILEYFGWVSSANIVKIRVCNPHGGSANAAVSSTVRIDLWKH